MFLVRRVPQWVPILLAGTLYGVAFALPTVAIEWSSENQPPRTGEPISGNSAFHWAFILRSPVWLANPLLWFAAFFLAWRLWPWAAALAITATGVAIWPFVRDLTNPNASSYEVGYWLWVGSMATLATTALLGWMRFVPRDRRRSPFEVFAGWRGVTVASWLATGLAFLGIAWFYNVEERGEHRRKANEEVVSDAQTVAGVTFILERKGHGSGYSGSHGGQMLSYEVGTHKIEFNNGELTLDGIDRGDLKAGDTVRLAIDGTLYVNENPTGPHPIQPKRVDPTPILLAAGDAGVVALTWTPPGRLIALTTDKTIRGWDLPKPIPAFALSTRGNAAFLAVSPDGKRIAAATQGGSLVFVWNRLEELPARVTKPAGRIGGIAFFDNERLIEARGEEAYVRRLGKDDEQPIGIGPVRHDQRPLAVSGDGQFVARLLVNETLALTRLIDRDGVPTPVPGRVLEGFSQGARFVLNRDGSLLFAHRNGFTHQNLTSGLFVFDTASGAQVSRLRWRQVPGWGIQILSAAFSPDGTLLAVGEMDSVRVFDVASGRERAWFGSPPRTDWMDNRVREFASCNAVAFSPDGKYLVAGFGEGKGPKLLVWDTATFLNAPEK